MSDPKRLIEVYNTIQGTNYLLDMPVEINTLDDVLYKEWINDIFFTLDGKYVILIEHQSTINENIPVRMLLYLGRLYEKIMSKKTMYRRKRIALETPEFLALYNGRESYLEESLLRLSDCLSIMYTKNRDKGIELGEAIRQVVLYCEENDIMQPFLELCVWGGKYVADGMELGAEQGRKKERKNLILRLLAVMSQEQVAKTLQMTVEEIQRIAKS